MKKVFNIIKFKSANIIVTFFYYYYYLNNAYYYHGYIKHKLK